MSRESALEFFEASRVPYLEHGSHHCRSGWINICCPFCGDADWHLGYNCTSNYFSCYRCGFHSVISTVTLLAGCDFQTAKQMARRSFRCTGKAETAVSSDLIVRLPKVSLPSSGDILRHREACMYLRNRFPFMSGPDFKKMILNYQITYTDSMYATYKYSSRIVFPNILEGKIVSFQCRDYTGCRKTGYITAKPEEESVFHKDFLWGIEWVSYNKIIVNEGVMDSLSIGPGAVHTHGANFSDMQAEALYGFDHVFICFDMDKAGIAARTRLAAKLAHRVKVTIVKLSCHDVNSCGAQEIADIKGLLQ